MKREEITFDQLFKGLNASRSSASTVTAHGASDIASAASELTIGDYVENEGYFACVWAPVDEAGRSIGKTFDVFITELADDGETYDHPDAL